MARTGKRMHRSARRHHKRGGMVALSPADVSSVSAGPKDPVVVGADDQVALPDWKKTALKEMGYAVGDDNQTGGRRHRHKTSKRHGKKRGGRKSAKRHSKRHSRRHSKRHSKRGGSACGCGM